MGEDVGGVWLNVVFGVVVSVVVVCRECDFGCWVCGFGCFGLVVVSCDVFFLGWGLVVDMGSYFFRM